VAHGIGREEPAGGGRAFGTGAEKSLIGAPWALKAARPVCRGAGSTAWEWFQGSCRNSAVVVVNHSYSARRIEIPPIPLHEVVLQKMEISD
jgi:hypothetical protein